MKLLLLVLCAAAVAARPNLTPDDEEVDPVDVIINGVPEGEPLEIGHIFDVKLKEDVNGEVVSATNDLIPYTAEDVAADAAETDSPRESELEAPDDVPEPVILPPSAAPEVIPDFEVHSGLPQPKIFLSQPLELEVIPDSIVLSPPAAPEVAKGSPEVEALPAPEAQGPDRDIIDDGSVTAPEGPGVVATLQSWFSMAMNYFNSEVAGNSHQIV